MRTGRIFGGLFCLLFVAAGLLFGAFILRDAWVELAPYFWPEVDCQVLQSASDDSTAPRSGTYNFAVRFEYEWNHQTHISERLYRRPQTFAQYQKIQQFLGRYPAGARVKCRVNANHPQEAVLEKRFPWILLGLVIPLVFIGVGSVGCYGALVARGPGESPAALTQPPPRSSRVGAANTGCLFLFCLLFFGVGAFVFHLMVIRPLFLARAAQGWTEVPCEVVSSEVQRHRGGKSTTYRIDILYAYQVAGRPYRANRYDFSSGSSSGHDAKASIVQRYPAGLKTVCYVNPADPTDAVLSRGMPGEMWLAIIPGAFMAAGAGGMFFAFRQRSRWAGGDRAVSARARPLRRSRETVPSAARAADNSSEGGPLVLRAGSSRRLKFVVFLVFAAVWNGVISVFVAAFLRGEMNSAGWIEGLFLLPFVLIGLGLIAAVFYLFLALFAPRPCLTLARTPVRVGETVELAWSFLGRARRIEKLRIYLEGREEAVYQRGTRTSTDRSIFAEVPIVQTADPVEISGGQAKMSVPLETVPTLAGSHNRIVWCLKVKGVIRLYPDVDDEFEIAVAPRKGAA
jgi:hypothetical protein